MHKLLTHLTRQTSYKLLAATALLCAAGMNVQAQGTKLRVLFIGNSFTETNNMPVIVDQIARSMGDTLIFDSNTPGGQTFEGHSTDAGTIGKISKADWNYVVLQEQSQRPAFPDVQVAMEVFPYARFLDSLVHDKNKCGRSVFFMTWGYPDGDIANCATFPPVCTYKGMDSLLNKRYTEMAIDNNALLSPVGQVFRELMITSPSINLFAADHIHPSDAGSFAAALTFYSLLYKKDPMMVPYSSILTPPDAAAIKHAVQSIVYSALAKWHVGEYDPKAGFSTSIVANTVTFSSTPSINVINYHWDFGDGNTSTLANPVHTYTATGTYNVKLAGDNCILTDSAKKDVIITTLVSVTEQTLDKGLKMYPNPAGSLLNLEAENGVVLNGAAVSISNTLGVAVYADKAFDGAALKIGHLPAGIYFVQLRTLSGAVITAKFSKQ